MDPVGVNVIEKAALGRPFQLGMLYDCRKDALIPGIRLWNKEQLQQNICTCPQINTEFNVTASDSIQDKSKLLNIDGGLKLSFLGDLIHVSGAAKYLSDTKTSFKQQRLTLHYHSTSQFKELTLNYLPFRDMADDDLDIATHVVTAILYGADACFVFDREVSSDEDKSTVEGDVKVALEKLQGAVSVGANAVLNVNHSQQTAVKKFTCTFYGDFQLPSNPTSFEDALKVFTDLPELLKDNQELAIPLRVWLFPLSNLHKRASKLHKDIRMDLIMKIESVIESLNTTEMKCSDLLKDSPAQTFVAFHDKILNMRQNCCMYKLRLMKNLGYLLPNIRGDMMKETALIDLLQEHAASPFRRRDLSEWLKERERESEIIKTVLRQLSDYGAQVEVKIDAILMDLEVGNLVSYTFTSLNHSDVLLLQQTAYLSPSAQGETDKKSPDFKQTHWLTPKVQKSMRSYLKIFKNLIDSKDCKPAKFIVSAKEMEDDPGSCILLYENGCDKALCFIPPSKPACPVTEEVKGQSVVLKVVPSSCPATVELRLLYKPKQDTVWRSEPVQKDQHTVTLTDLREGIVFEIKCAAVGKLNYTVYSDVIRVTTERKSKNIGTTGIKVEKIDNLFHRLHLGDRNHNKLRAAGVLQITKHSLQSHESCAEEELIRIFIQKLLMMDYRARYLKVKENNEKDHTQQQDYNPSKDEGDMFHEMSLANDRTSQSERIHPMDVQMAVFHCADGFLKQLMVTKLSQCQYALPLLVPDPFTQQIEFPLWTFRQINKSWKKRNTNNETISQTQPIYKAQTPMVFFFRFGSVSSSKSQLMNSLINGKHNTFFHRNCPGSSRTRVLMDGVVEIAWFCPSGTNDDKFTDCVAFCNLHGDAGDHEKQLQILTEMASVNVVLLPQLQRNDRNMKQLDELQKGSKPLICLFTEDETAVTVLKEKYRIGLKNRNQSDVSEELRRAIKNCLSESSSTFRLSDLSKHSDIRVDEEDDDDCRRGRAAAKQMMSLLEKKDLRGIKETFLPHQGKLWHQWSQINKELHRPQGDEIEMDISRKQTDLKKIREQQHASDISEFVKLFIKEVNTDAEHEKMFFVKWIGILLNEYISADLSALHHKYNEKWSTVLTMNDSKNKSEQLTTVQIDLERISKDLQAAALGLEHIMREIGQIYESCSSVKKNKKDLQVHFSSLPSLAAEMMISGFPLELMDGDAAHVPLIWISAVLDQLIQKLGDQRVFVLSVLGLQSSGKSTMLNAMFGLQFAVSAGRCTRGAFMQLVRVSDEMKTQMKIDFILVVDTEGLCAPELAGKSTKHDSELATFVVGLANLTLINFFGENPAEMQDVLQIVVQAFMRMKKVRLNPSCVFVHQNVSDVTAGEKNMEGRRRLQETLDEMTKLAAKEEECDAECFSDVTKFDIQNDVRYFAHLWEGSPPMAPPNPNYCVNIQELKETIMDFASKLHGMMLIDLKVRIKDLWEALQKEPFVFSFNFNAFEIAAYRTLEPEYNKWSWSLCSAMMETENKLHNKIENGTIHEIEETDLKRELKKTIEEVKKSMSEFFEKVRDKDKLIQWKASFDLRIKELQENIVRETKRKLNELLQQRDLKKKIDAQRTHYENTLYEKCKQLALKFKDKANDEETLKKEFDSFWEQRLNKIITDIPPIKDIDIMTDLKQILSDIYKSAHHYSESCDIFTVSTYSEYVLFRKSSKRVKETNGFTQILSPADEAQIRSLVTDVALQTDIMIQSFNISKMGYNISRIQKLTGYIKTRVTEHQTGQVKYVFKINFFMDLVLSICKRGNKMITDQHRLFREANDPVIYVEKKREEYYSIFLKYCYGATSAAIFGEIICQKLKKPIEQSVYKKTARDLASEMRSNCESLNGNRSNLEKHILETLAEEEDFDKYMNYIHEPRDHFKSFIRDEVSQYITDKFSVSVLPKMKENIELLQQKIMKAAHESTEHVKLNRGDVGLWLKSFTQRLSDDLIFSEKDLSGVKHDDVDVKLLEDVMEKELPAMSEISENFNTKTFPVKLDYKSRPDELLIDHFCWCCWAQCPFCTNTVENHDGDHNVAFHRVRGTKGWHFSQTQNLCAVICTKLVACDQDFYEPDGTFPLREHRRAGGVYADWSITPDLSELPYWKWFLYRFQKDLEKYYNKTVDGYGKIPDEWKKYSKQDAIESLGQCI
uniref:Interferon-induced very large GTPase 1-like n=1 Tax=Cyprinus carpio carpio TaxID=630221 RepID=A0A9J8C1T1_CYPCA